MGAVYFYQLTHSGVEATLSMLIERSLRAGWRVAVRAPDAARLKRLDEVLWLGEEDQFLAHGLAGGPHDALQPVLLTTGAEMPNAATCLMSLDGAAIGADEVSRAERACILFDGNDPAALAAARVQWKSLTDAGVSAQYWSEESGRWQKKAER